MAKASTTKSATLVTRPPIVVIMGHVDHGKSTLLDYIRHTNIVAGEAGGITQHISAYEVVHKSQGKESRITFLDTPGHAAFQGMRSRGAKVADIAVLVVSAEDGVKTQTLEAHKAIKESGIPYVVAINKIDKPNANIERTKLSLAEAEIYVEGYGGDVPCAPISAKTGDGVSELLDVILLVAEMSELTGDSMASGEGVVIEARMDPKKGATTTIVVTNGTFMKGTCAASGVGVVPVRIMEDFLGRAVETATFSSPIRLSGWSTLPDVGAVVHTYATKKEAESHATRKETTPKREDRKLKDGGVHIPIILRADVAGSLEALEHEIAKLTHDRVLLKIIQKGVGAISESDIKLAASVDGPIVIAFHTKADALAQDLASRANITIHQFDIIYKLSEWLEEEMLRRAPHFEKEQQLGEFRIIRCFSQQKDRQVIGGAVTSGVVQVGARFRIMRRDAEIGEGKIVEVQSQKTRVSEVSEGLECGLQIESKFTLAERDVLIPFSIVRTQ